MKITKYIAVLLAGIGIAFGSSAFAAQISVPSASAVAQMLVSLANGTYQASSSPTLSGRLTASSFTATSTTVNNVLPLLSVTRSTTTAATTTSFGITGVLSSLLKTTSTGGVVAAALGTDYINLSSLSASSPISYNNGTGAFSWTGLATTSQPSSSNLLVSNGGAGVYGVATTSANCSGNTTCTPFTVIGSSPITISSTGGGTGLSTTSPVSNSNVLVYSSVGAGSAYGVATTSLSVTGPITFSGTLGAQIGGAAGSFGCATCATFTYPFPSSATTSALSLANITYTNATGTNSTTTTSWANIDAANTGRFTILTATGTGFANQSNIPWLTITNSTTTSATTTNISSTNASTTNLWISGISSCSGSNALTTTAAGLVACGAITGGSGVWPFTTGDTNFGVSVQSTSTPEWFTAGVFASGTSRFVNQITYGSSTSAWNNGMLYADVFSGSDACAKINAAYSYATTGQIIIAPAGFQTCSTGINFSTAGKYVKLIFAPSQRYHYTGTGNAIKIDWGNYTNDLLKKGMGIEGGDFYGDLNSVGLFIGGANGGNGTTIRDARFFTFATGTVVDSNTWDIDMDNVTLQYNTKNLGIQDVTSPGNAGEALRFNNMNISDCQTVTKCIDLISSSASVEFVNPAIDDAQIYIHDGNARVSIRGAHFENPNSAATGKYTFLYIESGSNIGVSVIDSFFLNGTAVAGNSPYQFIQNGGNLMLSGNTFADYDLTMQVAVTNFGNGSLTALGNSIQGIAFSSGVATSTSETNATEAFIPWLNVSRGTTTAATSTSFFSTTGKFTNLTVTGTCTGCGAGSGASSTLLGDNNTFSGSNIFAAITRSTTTQSTTTNAFASSLFSLNGTFTTINATGTSFATQSSIPFLTITRSTTTYATTTYLNVSGGATTTFGNGISLSGGCFFVNGACITPGAGSSAVGGTGAIQYANGTSFAGDNTKFTWDSTNLRLSIGTGTPFAKFSVQGAYGSSENMIDVASSTNSSGSATSSLLLLTSDGKLVVNSHVGNGVNTIEAKNDYNDATFACRSTAGYGACWFNLYATAPQYFGIQGFDSSAGDNLVWKIGRSGGSDGVYIYTLDGNTLAAQFTDTQNFLVPTGKIGVGTSTPFAMLSVQGTLGSQNLLFNIASSTGSNSYLSIFSVMANGTVSTDFLSGTTTKNRAINEPDSIAVLTAANTNSMYNDDLSRMIQCSSVANTGQVSIRNGSFSTAASNVYHVTGGAQQMGMGSLTNSVMTARGCITYGGYHYVLVASSTNATAVAIRRATSSDYVNVGIATAWATSTVSGTVFTGGLSATFPILLGAANGSIYIATSTTAIARYHVSTSTNTLTYVNTTTITGASIAITNTRVNNNGLYVGFAAAPIVRKYDFSGNLLPGANYIAATPGNGPDLVATANSIYALSAGSTVLLSRIQGW